MMKSGGGAERRTNLYKVGVVPLHKPNTPSDLTTVFTVLQILVCGTDLGGGGFAEVEDADAEEEGDEGAEEEEEEGMAL